MSTESLTEPQYLYSAAEAAPKIVMLLNHFIWPFIFSQNVQLILPKKIVDFFHFLWHFYFDGFPNFLYFFFFWTFPPQFDCNVFTKSLTLNLSSLLNRTEIPKICRVINLNIQYPANNQYTTSRKKLREPNLILTHNIL